MSEEVLYLAEADVRTAGLPMRGLVEALDSAFQDLGERRADVPPKIGVHPSGSCSNSWLAS